MVLKELFVLVVFTCVCAGEAENGRYRNLPVPVKRNEQGTELENYENNPRETWFIFQTTDLRNSKLNKKSKNKKSICTGPMGPHGPSGPPGPPGPPGAQVTEARMLAEFRKFLKETADQRANKLGSDPLGLIAAGIPDVLSAFHVEIKHNVNVPKKSKHEMSDYRNPNQFGTFIRGNDFDLKSGRYIAPHTAVYEFSASLHITRQREANLRPRDNVSIMICMNALCELRSSLNTVTGLSSNSRVFTVSVQGLLHLRAGYHVSVFVDNGSGDAIGIQAKSTFTGRLVGA